MNAKLKKHKPNQVAEKYRYTSGNIHELFLQLWKVKTKNLWKWKEVKKFEAKTTIQKTRY